MDLILSFMAVMCGDGVRSKRFIVRACVRMMKDEGGAWACVMGKIKPKENI